MLLMNLQMHMYISMFAGKFLGGTVFVESSIEHVDMTRLLGGIGKAVLFHHWWHVCLLSSVDELGCL